MKLSAFGETFCSGAGIVELMDDLGSALNENPDMIFMGGGNPGRIPAVEATFQRQLETVLADPQRRHSLFGIYQSTRGDRNFRRELAALLQRHMGWPLTEANIAVANGSQSAFFMLHNMFAGPMPDGSAQTIHLPLTPEYIGYADVGLGDAFFSATAPEIEQLHERLFKYRIDFSELRLNDTVGALCVSRPTNPTGNVITDTELEHLDQLAREHNIPLIIDGAYGPPFPNITFCDATPLWNDNIILALSLSKLGLPGARTGIIVAREDIIEAYTRANTIVSLACGNMGPAIATELCRDDSILQLSNEHVAPFYQQRSEAATQAFHKALEGLPYHIHKPEGAIFLWLWFEGLPISSQQLYQRLKQRGVLIVPGHNFFVGLNTDWEHQHECIRVSYAQDRGTIEQGIAIIAEEVRRAYAGVSPKENER